MKNFLVLQLTVTFEKHIKELSKKGNLKLHALTRYAKFISTEKRHVIFKGFIISQLNYCPLVGMFHTKQREKTLRVIYQDGNSFFNELLNLDKSVSIHYRNIKYLLTEIYRVKMGPSPPIMSDTFSLSENSF